MSRDAFASQEIWKDLSLKIQGPPTSTPGLYHGVTYYYLLAIPYFMGQGDPRFAAIFLALINSLTVIPIMFLAKDFFKKKSWIILSGLLFAVSFEANQFGPWLSNPSPAVFTVAMFFYSLRVWQKGNIWGLIGACFWAAVSTQFQFFLIALFLLIPLFYIYLKPKVNNKGILLAVLFTFIGLSTFIIAIIKFNSISQVVQAFSLISDSGSFEFRPQFSVIASNYINRYADIFINNFFPVNSFIGGILGILSLYFARADKFLVFALLANIPIFALGGHNSPYVNIGMVTPVILAVINFLRIVIEKRKLLGYLLISMIITSNLYMHFKIAPLGQIEFVIPNEMLLKNQLNLIDKTYEIANGQPFSINSITLPIWNNTTWSYLYQWYGNKKYGYTPSFSGKDQIGLPGNNYLKYNQVPENINFLIIESNSGIPAELVSQEMDTENAKTTLREEMDFKGLKLQLRVKNEN